MNVADKVCWLKYIKVLSVTLSGATCQFRSTVFTKNVSKLKCKYFIESAYQGLNERLNAIIKFILRLNYVECHIAVTS